MRRIAALLITLAMPTMALAERLRVDVLIFLNPPPLQEHATATRHPDNERAIGIDDLRGLAYAGIALLPENASSLASEWATLSANRSYRPLLRLSWLQEAPDSERGPAMRIYLPGGDGQSSLEGWLRLQGGGMHPALMADLESVQTTAGGNALGYRLKQRRSLPLNTLHYLDSPRIGVLARVSPAR